MRRALLVLWMTNVGVHLQAVAQSLETGKVTIHAVTTFGVAIGESAYLELKEIGSGTRYQGKGAPIMLTVPYGIFQLQLRVPGFEPTIETVTVYQAEIEYRIGLAVGFGHAYERARLDGTVVPIAKDQRGLWVKLSPMYNGGVYQSTVTQYGAFSIVGMPHGKYILSVCQGAEVKHTESIDIVGGKHRLQVRLPAVDP